MTPRQTAAELSSQSEGHEERIQRVEDGFIDVAKSGAEMAQGLTHLNSRLDLQTQRLEEKLDLQTQRLDEKIDLQTKHIVESLSLTVKPLADRLASHSEDLVATAKKVDLMAVVVDKVNMKEKISAARWDSIKKGFWGIVIAGGSILMKEVVTAAWKMYHG